MTKEPEGKEMTEIVNNHSFLCASVNFIETLTGIKLWPDRKGKYVDYGHYYGADHHKPDWKCHRCGRKPRKIK